MRHRCLAAGLTVAGLVDDQCLAGVARLTCGAEKASAILSPLEQANNRLRVVVFGKIRDKIADIDVAGIASREMVRKPNAALHALPHRVPQPPASPHAAARAS